MPCEIFLGGINMTDTMEEVLEMRRMCKKSDDARDAGLPREVPGVRRIDDLSYGPDPKWHLLDLYLPENVEGKIPVIINVHGGGYCYGTKETYQFYGLNLAAHGFAFVNPNYHCRASARGWPCRLRCTSSWNTCRSKARFHGGRVHDDHLLRTGNRSDLRRHHPA